MEMNLKLVFSSPKQVTKVTRVIRALSPESLCLILKIPSDKSFEFIYFILVQTLIYYLILITIL